MTQPSDAPRDATPDPEPPAPPTAAAPTPAEPTPAPAPPPAPEGSGPPAPPVWERPDPLSFGPPEQSGPPVSPAIAAYKPPPVAPVSSAPVTSPPVTSPPAPAPFTPPVSAAPGPTMPVPSPPPPAAYYPPPAYASTTGYPPVGYPAGYPAGFAYPAVDPVTGQPLSDKSKVAAGLLQLLPGFLLAIGGIGRLYAGHTGLGVTQLVLSIVSWALLICAFWLVVPIVTFVGLWVWFIVDGILLLAGRPVDGQGRLLRS